MCHRALAVKQCSCSSNSSVNCELSHSCLPHRSSASKSPHFSSAQLVLLRELIKVTQDYTVLLDPNTGFLSFLNTILPVNCPEVTSFSTYKLSTIPFSPITTVGRWHGTDTPMELCSFYRIAESGSSPHTIDLCIKTKKSAVTNVATWVIF